MLPEYKKIGIVLTTAGTVPVAQGPVELVPSDKEQFAHGRCNVLLPDLQSHSVKLTNSLYRIIHL